MKKLSLREIQLNTLIVLKKIKSICEKENIKYFLAYGTMLGAVRHKGFIPWDDDIDIMMPREDYERFINYCINNKDQLLPFSLMHYKTSKDYVYPIARFIDTRYKIDYENTKDYGLGLFVDIYPLDGTNYKDIKVIKLFRLISALICLMGTKEYIKSKSCIKNLIKYLIFYSLKTVNLNFLLKKIDEHGKKYDFDKSEYADCTIWFMQKRMIRKELYTELVFQKFEDDYFPIPAKYDQLLKIYYGDYLKLPPIEERIGHHFYTVYKK